MHAYTARHVGRGMTPRNNHSAILKLCARASRRIHQIMRRCIPDRKVYEDAGIQAEVACVGDVKL